MHVTVFLLHNRLRVRFLLLYNITSLNTIHYTHTPHSAYLWQRPHFLIYIWEYFGSFFSISTIHSQCISEQSFASTECLLFVECICVKFVHINKITRRKRAQQTKNIKYAIVFNAKCARPFQNLAKELILNNK